MNIKIILISIITSIFFGACDSTVEKDNPYNPKTLKELHQGFFTEELNCTIDTVHKDSIVIITTGHLYPMLKYPDVYDSLFETIKKQNADKVFLLGDLVRNNSQEEWNMVMEKVNQLNCPVYFTPGNHDLNYHWERWEGSRAHQYEAEMTYVNNVGYRYKTIEDNEALYVFINPNDSLDRVINYLNLFRQNIDTTSKLKILLSSQSLWHDKKQNPDDPHTWVEKAFSREEILPRVETFDYLIHGDWGGKLYQGTWPKSNGKFKVLSVGNRKQQDPVFITRLTIYNGSIIAKSISVPVDENSDWFK